MSDIRVVPMTDTEFGVQVHEADERSDHVVTVDEQVLDDLGLVDVDLAELVEQSFEFLLERELPVEIPEELSLSDISRDHDDYLGEMRARLE